MATSEAPAFSVIVPTRARPGALGRCIAALRALEPAGGPTELIIVDDDPAGSAARLLAREPDVRLVHSDGRGPAGARNLGIELARGATIALTDDDCEPAPGWLRGMAAALGPAPAGSAAVGTTLNGERTAFAEASHIVVEALQRTHRGEDAPAFAPSNNVCFPRRELLELGGFDERFPRAAGEDRELSERWLAAGHRFVDAPGALLFHRHAHTLSSFWRQHSNYGRGAFAFHNANGGGHRRSLRSQSGFLRALAAELGEAASGPAPTRLVGLVLLSQLANAWGYLGALGSSRERVPVGGGPPGSS